MNSQFTIHNSQFEVPHTRRFHCALCMVYCALLLIASLANCRAQGVADDTTYIYRSISSAMENPDKVFRLNLSRKKLTKFPMEIFSFKNLRELDLSHNKIDSIPERIGELINLEKVNLSNNKLVHLPDSIGALVKVTYLGLNRNQIEALPTTIGKMEQLETLELWDNELYTIPDEIGNLKNLKVLELRGILFSDEEAARIISLLPETKVLMSPSCNCKF